MGEKKYKAGESYEARKQYAARGQYGAIAQRAGCIRKKYRLVPFEAAWCALWLRGVKEKDIPALAEKMDKLRAEKRKVKR